MDGKAAPVEEGDTVRIFADRYQTTVAILRELNGTLDVDLEGFILSNELLVPTASSAGASETETVTTESGVAEKTTASAQIGAVNVPIELVAVGGGKRLATRAANAYLQMVEAAKKDSIDLPLKSAYRDIEEQKRLYAKFLAGTGNPAAKPGKSQHQQGLSIDVLDCPFDSDRYKWLTLNAGRFGFVANALTTHPPESWHWTYLG
jgi:LAS superfamily LD-carboxypeptidase LdcB